MTNDHHDRKEVLMTNMIASQVQGPATDRWEAEVGVLIIKFHFSHSHCSFDRHRPRTLIINRDPQVGLVWQSGSGLINSESQERRQLARPGRGQVQPRQVPRLTRLKKSMWVGARYNLDRFLPHLLLTQVG